MAITHLGTVTGSGTPSTLSFTSIPDTYASLIIRGVGYTTGAGPEDVYLQFNSTSTANNDGNRGGRFTGANLAYQEENTSFAQCAEVPGYDMATGGQIVTQLEMDLVSYRGDQPGNITWHAQGCYMYGTSTSPSGMCNFQFTGWYDAAPTVDVATITLRMSSNNWGANSVFDLYGRPDE